MLPIHKNSAIHLIAFCILLAIHLSACNPLAVTPPPEPLATVQPSATHVPTSTVAPTASPAATPTAIPTATAQLYVPPQHRIGVRQVDGSAGFFDRETGDRFIPRGVNYVFVPQDGRYSVLLLKVGVYDPQRTRRDFATLASYGYNTVRVFLDHCNAGPGCIGDSDHDGLNPAYLDNIADMLAAAREAGIYILFTSNDLPDQGGYSQQANAGNGPHFAAYRNAYYLTLEGVEATRRYWRDLLTGLNARSAATDRALGWQLLNEQWMFLDQPPLSLTSGEVKTTTGVYDMSDPAQKKRMVSEGLIHYIAEVKAEILEHDPTALVTMGFFAPELVAPGWYVETASLLTNADLDFFDFHAYPGWHSLGELVAAFGMQNADAKPIILGEYGAFRSIYASIAPAARAITHWQAESCAHGFDGWLYWTYYPADADVDDRTWGFTDESGLLLELLAPLNHPDPCAVVDVPSDNLAYRKPVQASASAAEQLPLNAVDENNDSTWNAGADAPQWIEIDLEQVYRLTEIRLLVAQWPPGETVHRIRGRRPGGDWLDLHTFSQSTQGGDWLVFAPEPAIEGIQIIRIETLGSPSWVAWAEIEVYGNSGTVPTGIGNYGGLAIFPMLCVLEPDLVAELHEIITDRVLKNMRALLPEIRDYVDVVMFAADDWGTQRNLIASPEVFRTLFLPYWQQINTEFHAIAPQVKRFLHSCGAIYDLIDLVIAAGFDILNPVQWSAGKHSYKEWKDRARGRIALWGGGVNAQVTLPLGTVADVEREVAEVVSCLAQDGGYVFCNIHNILAEIAPEKVIAIPGGRGAVILSAD